jgi:hypothetical protein
MLSRNRAEADGISVVTSLTSEALSFHTAATSPQKHASQGIEGLKNGRCACFAADKP